MLETALLGRRRIKYYTLTWILLVIFMGMVYTRAEMIIIG
jgi:hypothetical protein